jgi:hypothetical protein
MPVRHSLVAEYCGPVRWLSELPGRFSQSQRKCRIMRIEQRWATSIPLMGSSAACGFPSPADDYLDRPLSSSETPPLRLPCVL